ARTADSLFWLARYIERADYLARLLQVAGHMSAVRMDAEHSSEWESAIVAAGCREQFFALHDQATAERVIAYLAFNPDNPSSIVNCLETARRNARAVRTAITSEFWEAINTSWMQLRDFNPGSMDRASMDEDRLNVFLEWVKACTNLIHGADSSTMLRRDGFRFTRIGQFLERADNTARLLDVKYHVTLPSPQDVGGLVDYYQWLAILRMVGARRAYRVLFKGSVEPAHIAELLILRPEFPRSLTFCFEQITVHLDGIADHDPRLSAQSKRLAHAQYSELRFGRIEQIFEQGLHEYLSEVIDGCKVLGAEIARGHLF
ncbi:MAG TPA: alpha-E domain-containing protein, partial [Xanthomonadaceae bacterium]|nr:alpha-E domain-containing protein [Xanthomonadaceae bacterium]